MPICCDCEYYCLDTEGIDTASVWLCWDCHNELCDIEETEDWPDTKLFDDDWD